ncbi:FAD-dependent oxidoreductase [Guptibacillus hwajinpoensis]|uniref:FAD-dependent oxidoreductase n=1 Tax=Guptibacillus hwajinpoensis TaxID=208199 RepID=UPI00273F9C73|nr:FAD-dependent oxidoreductase [Pseudalkalibacillus hwajinpoensis]WLR61462.1 FAD-dependent oxidoreductase [Pseudalkalibacillus hwajinpoensis]
MDVCIVGGGIAGLTLAYCLSERGDQVTIVERSPSIRTEGYMIDFFGAGYDVAEKLRMLDDLSRIHYPIDSLAFLKGNGSEKYRVSYQSLRELLNQKHFNFMRGDLEKVLYEKVRKQVAFRFGVSPKRIEQDAEKAHVSLSDGTKLTCDLVVGADGMRSKVRSLSFKEEKEPIRYMGYYTAAYIVEDPAFLEKIDKNFYTYSEPNRQVSVYPIRGNKVATFFLYRYPEQQGHVQKEKALEQLNEYFGHMNWIVPDLLEAGTEAKDFYFDEVSQVGSPKWRNGRIAFVGDSCQCISLLAGQGASMAMAGAYTLAKSLDQHPNDLEAALTDYERSLHPDINKLQKSARRFASFFLPSSWWGIFVRDILTRVSVWPGVRKLVNFSTVRLPK